MTQLQSRIRRALTRLNLLPVAFVAWRTLRELSPSLLKTNFVERRKVRTIPIPPSELIFSATGTRNVRWFLESGAQTAASFREALERIGRPLDTFHDVLDLGCGCGRVLRQWETVQGPQFYGTDYNPRGIQWGKSNLKFVRYSSNLLTPPLPFAAAKFDLCYAVSVFTHLPESLQRPWIEELHRVIEPGGILLLTLSGEGDLVRVTAAESESFFAGNIIVVDDALAGTNLCGVYHPQSYVRRNWSDLFEIKKVYEQGARGVPKQDLYVLQRI